VSGGELVAVGGWTHYQSVPADTTRGRAAVWASHDGSWIELTSEAFSITELWPWNLTGVVEFDGDVIAIGTFEGRGAVWIGEWTD
jgi:hypothetical protein